MGVITTVNSGGEALSEGRVEKLPAVTAVQVSGQSLTAFTPLTLLVRVWLHDFNLE